MGTVKRAFDVAVVGNIGIDTNVYFPYGEMNLGVESNFTLNIDHIGQAGGYTSRGFARLDRKTAFIGYVGNDYSGRFIIDELARDGISVDGIFYDTTGTSRSINFMHSDGRRQNFYDGKNHMNLQPDSKICEKILGECRLAHFHIPNWARTLLPLAKRHGVVISCDIQDVVDPDDPYRLDFIRDSDILFFSATNHSGPEKLMQRFNQINPSLIQISGLGKKGCAVFQNGTIRYFDPIELEEPVIDTNGAGDGLATGFLDAFILSAASLEDAVMAGQIAARHTCAQKASSSFLISRERLNTELKRKKATMAR